ncbi:hypothetical protein [Cellulomonas marina]|uniref:Uncharacterized protein n=1 Tax=Cellulomonas marina TaxID=988821 RepID=A0A1I0VWN6_9CELL|nr:hypothetical protein [Cellulomonas marina]GIG27500.1 hypothetical protein Cma02nite_01000 [Cellulomonas marina]SFA80752.1 hypothetical protein SAMN05421867_10211 [Cellulomonas marina]
MPSPLRPRRATGARTDARTDARNETLPRAWRRHLTAVTPATGGLPDRVLASVRLADGHGWAVTTHARLVVLDDGARDGTEDGGGPADVPEVRVDRPWTDVVTASSDGTGALTVRWVDGTATTLPLVDSRASWTFAQTVRERVQRSLVHWLPVGTPAPAGTRVALRRAADESLTTQLLSDVPPDLSDERVAAAVHAAREAVLDAAGLPR